MSARRWIMLLGCLGGLALLAPTDLTAGERVDERGHEVGAQALPGLGQGEVWIAALLGGQAPQWDVLVAEWLLGGAADLEQAKGTKSSGESGSGDPHIEEGAEGYQ